MRIKRQLTKSEEMIGEGEGDRVEENALSLESVTPRTRPEVAS